MESYLAQKGSLERAARLSVAPMMAWTDRHCRFFHRLMSKQVLLYTEMVTAPALVRGGALQLLDHSEAEHPVALQLGGSDPKELAIATQIAVDHGFHEVNLNLGCPSDRVQSGKFGAILMTEPDLVFECLSAMSAVPGAIVTAKTRIGVDDQVPAQILPEFMAMIASTGVTRVILHARMAWLKGLSPKENRDIPPLDYPLVYAMKRQFPDLHLSINGGVSEWVDIDSALENGVDGVMIGRAAYHNPAHILLCADEHVYGGPRVRLNRFEVAEMMEPYIAAHLQSGGKLHHVTRHMLGLFQAQPGARLWRRGLSELGADETAGVMDYRRLCQKMPKNDATRDVM